MMRWIAQRFQYTRDLEKKERLLRVASDSVRDLNDFLEQLLEDYQGRATKFSKMTLDEVESLLSACVDYHEALNSLYAADPIQDRVIAVFEKYGVKIVRNKFASHDQRLSSRFKKTVDNRD